MLTKKEKIVYLMGKMQVFMRCAGLFGEPHSDLGVFEAERELHVFLRKKLKECDNEIKRVEEEK